MLRRSIALLAAIVAALTVQGVMSARADGAPVSCGPESRWDGRKCAIVVTSPGKGPSDEQSKTPLGAGPEAPRIWSFGEEALPCHDPEWGWWSDSKNCYVKLSEPQPPIGAPVWDGHTDGAIYDCSLPRRGGFGGLVLTFWSTSAPAGPDPVVLAQQAIASMNLRPISIGIVPEDRPGSVGLVGMPVWLWASSPDAQSWGPITRSASASGVTVTATAKVERVRWQMGDGSVVVCSGPGTVYEDRFGKTDSPTCGYTYSKQGTYTVRAESQWSVAWSGMGQSGTIPVTLNQATRITVGELQVLTTG